MVTTSPSLLVLIPPLRSSARRHVRTRRMATLILGLASFIVAWVVLTWLVLEAEYAFSCRSALDGGLVCGEKPSFKGFVDALFSPGTDREGFYSSAGLSFVLALITMGRVRLLTRPVA
jgi:hypothetical protein